MNKLPFNQNKKRSKKLSKFYRNRKRLLKPVEVSGTRTVYHREEGRVVGVVKDIKFTVPLRKGIFTKDIMDHCKDCPKIYCSGWRIEVTKYWTFYKCPKYMIQRKNKWAWIL